MDIALWSNDLKNVFRAVSSGKATLLLVFIFNCIIVYIYGLFAFLFFPGDFFSSGIGSDGGENMCASVSECWLTIFSLGMRSSGGIGDVMIRTPWSVTGDVFEKYMQRYVYDITCFIVINLIGLNIIFGIIIDAFQSLRQRSKRINYERDNVCFVCSVHKTFFERFAEGGFEYHTEEDHNIWNYLWFMYYLKTKD